MGVSISRKPSWLRLLADGECDFMSEAKVALHFCATEVDIAIF